ncbi:MAG: hypothetical protein ACRC5F_01900 [Cetobacterium sp.]
MKNNFRIVKKEVKIGEYSVVIFERFYKNFKKPLNFSWILPEEPLFSITKGDKNVLIVKNKSATINGKEIDYIKETENMKYDIEIIKLNKKIETKNYSYAFDNDNNAVKNRKKNFFFDIDNPTNIELNRIICTDLSSKKYTLIKKDDFLKREDLILMDDKGITKYYLKTKFFNQKKHEELMFEFNEETVRRGTSKRFRYYEKVKNENGEKGSMYVCLNDSTILRLILENEENLTLEIESNLLAANSYCEPGKFVSCVKHIIKKDGELEPVLQSNNYEFNIYTMLDKKLLTMEK